MKKVLAAALAVCFALLSLPVQAQTESLWSAPQFLAVESDDYKEITLDQAVGFCEWMIPITSSELSILQPGDTSVSPTMDIAAITPEKGFHWVYNDPTPSPSP